MSKAVLLSFPQEPYEDVDTFSLEMSGVPSARGKGGGGTGVAGVRWFVVAWHQQSVTWDQQSVTLDQQGVMWDQQSVTWDQ